MYIIKLWNKDSCRLSACCGTPRVRRGASALCQRRHWCTCCACCPACCTRRSNFTFDAVVRRTLVLIAVYRSHCFHVAVSVAIFLYLEVQCLQFSWSTRETLPKSARAKSQRSMFARARPRRNSPADPSSPSPSLWSKLPHHSPASVTPGLSGSNALPTSPVHTHSAVDNRRGPRLACVFLQRVHGAAGARPGDSHWCQSPKHLLGGKASEKQCKEKTTCFQQQHKASLWQFGEGGGGGRRGRGRETSSTVRFKYSTMLIGCSREMTLDSAHLFSTISSTHWGT